MHGTTTVYDKNNVPFEVTPTRAKRLVETGEWSLSPVFVEGVEEAPQDLADLTRDEVKSVYLRTFPNKKINGKTKTQMVAELAGEADDLPAEPEPYLPGTIDGPLPIEPVEESSGKQDDS